VSHVNSFRAKGLCLILVITRNVPGTDFLESKVVQVSVYFFVTEPNQAYGLELRRATHPLSGLKHSCAKVRQCCRMHLIF